MPLSVAVAEALELLRRLSAQRLAGVDTLGAEQALDEFDGRRDYQRATRVSTRDAYVAGPGCRRPPQPPRAPTDGTGRWGDASRFDSKKGER